MSDMSDMSDMSKSKYMKRLIQEERDKCSKDYIIPTPVQNAVGSDSAASKYTDEMIHQVCVLLSDPNNNMTLISKQTHVGYDMVYRIKKGLNWIHISSKYPALGISAKPDSANAVKLE